MKKVKKIDFFKKMLQKYKGKIIILSIISTFASILALIFAFFSKDLIDGITAGHTDRFIFFAILLSTLLILNTISQALSNWFQTKFGQLVIKSLKSDVYEHIIKSTHESRASYHSGKLMTLLENDIDIAGSGIVTILPKAIFYIVRFTGAFILLIIIDPIFSSVFLALGIVLFIASRVLAPHMKKRHMILQQAKDMERSFTQESIENIDVIQGFQAEHKMASSQLDRQNQIYEKTLSKTQLNILTSSGINLFFAFGYAFALIYGGYQLQFGLSVGYLIAIIQLIQHLQSPFSGLSILYPQYQSALASLERINLVKTLPFETYTKNQPTDFKAMTSDNISFSYNNHKVIDNLSFTIKKNQSILVKGPSGAGKSTLLKLMLSFIKPDEGELSIIDQNNKKSIISHNSRSLYSYVPQDNLILSGTIRDNLNLFHQFSDQEIEKVLKDVSLYDDIYQHPLNIDNTLQEKGKGLSEGQIQRLAIARALLKNAPILLLDEITSSLDRDTEMKLINHLKTLENKTIIMITHHHLPDNMFDQVIEIIPNKNSFDYEQLPVK